MESDRDETGNAALKNEPMLAWRSPWAWATLGVSTLLVAAADLLTKWLAFQNVAGAPVALDRHAVLAAAPDRLGLLIPQHEAVMVLPRVLELQLVLNPGAVFGVGAGKRWFFIAFTLLAMGVGVWVFARWTHARSRWAHVALGLVLGGGLGNLYDRVQLACVRDFLHPLPDVHLPFGLSWLNGSTEVWPWVSNVADATLLIGIGILIVGLWRSGNGEKEAGE